LRFIGAAAAAAASVASCIVADNSTLDGLLGWGLGVWKWWESRESNLFRRFEEMMERQEARLVKACSDPLDIMRRPGPGLLIGTPLFVE
jgi:hypothetical protein